MSGKSILTIYGKEMLELSRDRRTLISMIVVPLAAIPVLFMVTSYFMTAREKTAESEAVTVAVQANLRTPGLAAALRGAGLALVTVADVREAVGKKQAAAGVEEGARATGEPEISIYEDKTRQASGIAGDKVRIALDGLKADKVREALNGSGVSEKVLSPFFVKRVNVAAGKKMAGFVFGSIVGYTVILLMFSTCMYPSIDMTAGEKERRTLEALLCSPAQREEIVLGKILAATTAAFGSALLTVSSMIFSFRFMAHTSRASDAFLTAVPFTPKIIALVLLALLPTAGVAAAVMIAISAFCQELQGRAELSRTADHAGCVSGCDQHAAGHGVEHDDGAHPCVQRVAVDQGDFPGRVLLGSLCGNAGGEYGLRGDRVLCGSAGV
jgi:sodium transport system permease protein